MKEELEGRLQGYFYKVKNTACIQPTPKRVWVHLQPILKPPTKFDENRAARVMYNSLV